MVRLQLRCITIPPHGSEIHYPITPIPREIGTHRLRPIGSALRTCVALTSLTLSFSRAVSPLPPSSSSSSYREDYPSRHIGNDFYIRDDYRSLTPSSLRSSSDTYNETYQAGDYNNRSERYDITRK